MTSFKILLISLVSTNFVSGGPTNANCRAVFDGSSGQVSSSDYLTQAATTGKTKCRFFITTTEAISISCPDVTFEVAANGKCDKLEIEHKRPSAPTSSERLVNQGFGLDSVEDNGSLEEDLEFEYSCGSSPPVNLVVDAGHISLEYRSYRSAPTFVCSWVPAAAAAAAAAAPQTVVTP